LHPNGKAWLCHIITYGVVQVRGAAFCAAEEERLVALVLEGVLGVCLHPAHRALLFALQNEWRPCVGVVSNKPRSTFPADTVYEARQSMDILLLHIGGALNKR
jgi:hypothetical protein